MVLISQDNLMYDPTVFTLTLILTDNAIKDVSSVEQFYNIEPLDIDEKFIFKWNEDLLDKPIFSRIDRCKGVLEDQAWNYNNSINSKISVSVLDTGEAILPFIPFVEDLLTL